jgi:hypothetical protein
MKGFLRSWAMIEKNLSFVLLDDLIFGYFLSSTYFRYYSMWKKRREKWRSFRKDDCFRNRGI